MLDEAGILFCYLLIDTKHLAQERGEGLVSEIDLRCLDLPFFRQLDVPISLLVDIPISHEYLHAPVDAGL